MRECARAAYSETPESLGFHQKISHSAWARVKPYLDPIGGKTVLDVGCANGFALKMFEADGFRPENVTGITCSEADANEAWSRGVENVALLDMHEVRDLLADSEYVENGFDLIWARHVVEHSPIPLFLLREFRAVMRPGTGLLYVEVPAPDTPCLHATNENHYSCFGREGWEGLFAKAGLATVDTWNFDVNVEPGLDHYFCWLLKVGN